MRWIINNADINVAAPPMHCLFPGSPFGSSLLFNFFPFPPPLLYYLQYMLHDLNLKFSIKSLCIFFVKALHFSQILCRPLLPQNIAMLEQVLLYMSLQISYIACYLFQMMEKSAIGSFFFCTREDSIINHSINIILVLLPS